MIRFDPSLPKTHRARISKILKKLHAQIAPHAELIVGGVDMVEGGAAINVRTQYRDAQVACSLQLLAIEDDSELEDYLRHELVHVLEDPLSVFASRVIKAYVLDSATKALLEEELEDLVDGVTEDVARALKRGRNQP